MKRKLTSILLCLLLVMSTGAMVFANENAPIESTITIETELEGTEEGQSKTRAVGDPLIDFPNILQTSFSATKDELFVKMTNIGIDPIDSVWFSFTTKDSKGHPGPSSIRDYGLIYVPTPETKSVYLTGWTEMELDINIKEGNITKRKVVLLTWVGGKLNCQPK